MLFKLSKAAVALLALTAGANAAPAKRQSNTTNCKFLLSPSAAPPPALDLYTEFNYVIMHLLLVSGNSIYHTGVSSVTPVTGGKFETLDTVEIIGYTVPQTITFVEGSVGFAQSGFGSGITWTFEEIKCGL